MKGEGLETVRMRELVRSLIESYKLEDVMRTEYESAGPEDSVSDVVAKMKAADLHEIPVVEDSNKLMGVVSYGSLVRKKNIPTSTKAKTVLESPPRLTAEMPITQVAELMVSTSYRQIPVVRGKKILGVISRKEIIQIVADMKDLKGIRAADIMTGEVQTISPKDSIKQAVDIMRKLEVRTLPVVDEGGKLTGIIGIKDIANYNWRLQRRETVGEFTGNRNPVEVEVESLAVDNPVTIRRETSIGEAVRIMLDRNISTLPVVEEDRLAGILTTYDIVELVASFRPRDIVYVQITGLEDEDRHSLDVMDKEIQSEIARIAKISRPLLFTLHVTKYHHTGNSAKYSLSGRLITEEKIFVAKASEWNLMKATVEIMQRLQRLVREAKEERIDQRKRARA